MNPDTPGHAELIVPRRPGPLRALPSTGRRRSEIDEVLDEMFGADTDGASKTDLLLAVGGLLLIALGAALSRPTVMWIGAAVFALGLILPGRDVLRSAQGRRTGARDAAARLDGYPLRVEHQAVAALVREYEALLGEIGSAEFGRDAAEAGHLALVEVCGLLDGRDPVGSEADYVAARAEAVAALRRAVVEAEQARLSAQAQVEVAARDAGVAAIAAHDETAGDSLARMRALREVLDERS
jgi:hypothetical protein